MRLNLRSVGVAVLLIVLVALVGTLAAAALKQGRGAVEGAGETPGYAAPSPAVELQTPQSLPEPEAPEEETPVPSQTRLLSAADSLVAYRANVGSCPGGELVVEATLDGGATWHPTDLRGTADVSSARRIVAGSDLYAAVIAVSGQDCTTPMGLATFDGGFSWQPLDESVGQSWFIDPADLSLIHTPQADQVAAPCPAVRLASSGVDSVTLVCEDGSIATSPNRGSTWNHGPAPAGIEGLAQTPGSIVAAALDPAVCPGTSITVFNNDLQEEATSCVPAEAQPGAATLSAGADGTLWLWAGDTTLRSIDGGAKWSP